MTTQQLKPCPFCGTPLDSNWEGVFEQDVTGSFGAVYCSICEIHGPKTPIVYSDKDTDLYDEWKEKAIQKWNTRAYEELEK